MSTRDAENAETKLLMHQGSVHLVKFSARIILRHANLSTTQGYLGKVSDTEAMQWIENIYG
jgi:hypothetical protein